MTNQAPQWARDYFAQCRKMLGITDDWRLKLELSDSPGESDTTDGYCALDARYLQATITVRRGLKKKRMRHVVMHELFHIVFAPIDRHKELHIRHLPKKRRRTAHEAYTDAEEQVIERLTRALQERIT